MTPGKIAVIVGAGLFTVLTLIFIAMASPSAGFTNGFCLSCHDVKEQGKTLAQTSHGGTACLTCHQRPGVLGAVDSVFDGAANLASWVNPFNGPSAARSGTVDSGRCLMCHQRTSRTSDVLNSKLTVDHRHFRKVGISCIQCHRGVAHGEKLARGGGMTKQLCIGCHNGIDASQECSVCHKQDVRGVRPVNQNTALGVAHGPKWKQSHAMGNLKTCSLCHKPTFCKECHGIGLPHDDGFLTRHGKISAGKISDVLKTDEEDDSGDQAKPVAAVTPVTPLAIGKSLFESKCVICHGLDRPRGAPYKGDEWKSLVERMRGKGAPVSEEEASKIIAYLIESGGGKDQTVGAAVEAGGSKATGFDGKMTPAAISVRAKSVQKSCATCHQKSYCKSCHGNVEMPHRSQWLSLHQKNTPESQVPVCFRCHVNEECIGCHQAHKDKNLRFPTGPVVEGIPIE